MLEPKEKSNCLKFPPYCCQFNWPAHAQPLKFELGLLDLFLFLLLDPIDMCTSHQMGT